MRAVHQDMSFGACALPIESYSICGQTCYVALRLHKLSYQGRARTGGHITLSGTAMVTSSDRSLRLMSVVGHPADAAVGGASSSSAASFMRICTS